jgi:hypothetical protein
VEVELFHANGRTDMTKLIIALRNFVNALNKSVCARAISTAGYIYTMYDFLEITNESSFQSATQVVF